MTHVIVPDYPIRVQFSVGGTPTTGPFNFSFTFFDPGDLDVYAGSVLLPSSQYNVVGNPGAEGGYAGGYITLGPVANTTITIHRVLPLERVSDFPDAGPFNRMTLNTTLDKHVAMIQQVDERVDRTFVMSPDSPTLDLIARYFPRVNDAATGMELISPEGVRLAISAQPVDTTLTALAALPAVVSGQIIVANGAESFGLAAITVQALNLLDDPDAAAMRNTLALGSMATQNSNAVNITGGTISGVAVAVPGLGTMSTQNANAVAITGGTITGMPVPDNFADVCNKQYADSLAFGVNKRSTVRAASTADVLLASLSNGSALDGVVLATTDRILIKNQANPAQNGVYLVGAVGTSLRATDFDTYDECPGSLVTIQEGTVNQDTVYLCVSNAGGTLGTTAIDFTKVKVSPNIPVVIGEGGTGQTTALAAFDALKQPASAAYVGAIQLASQAEVDAGANTVKAVVPATLATRLASVMSTGVGTRHDCRFDYINGSICRLSRHGGAQITIDAVLRTIPAGGVDFAYVPGWGSGGGFMAYIYATWNGSAIVLAADTNPPVRDARDGNFVNTVNSAWTIVGMVVGGYGSFIQDGTHLGVLSFWNRRAFYLQAAVSGVTTASTTPIIVSALATNALNWFDETLRIGFTGYGANSGNVSWCATDLYYDSNSLGSTIIAHSHGAGYLTNQTTWGEFLLVEGWHSIAPYVWVNASGGTWYGRFTVATRG